MGPETGVPPPRKDMGPEVGKGPGSRNWGTSPPGVNGQTPEKITSHRTSYAGSKKKIIY